ncbi:class I SAM-dependent methyltransferase [Sinomonas albida]|uniref:class I SAM-dependent methyltransferase n=1 Tax=Sinomonas albida TaxID=369942 RepID=UPI003016A1D3
MIEHFASVLQAPRRVLDAGCGAGRMMPILAGLGCQVEGVDLSPEMVRRAKMDHREFRSSVGSLTDLPFPAASFDGVFSWYSTIHSPDDDLPRIFAEARRVLRASGLLLIAFQAGSGTVDVSESYRRRGHAVTLRRYNRTPDQLSEQLLAAGFREVARLSRGPAKYEKDDQAVLIATPAGRC